MRVLLLGATGFIGSACLVRLLGQGFEVRAVARRHPISNRDNAEWVEADIARLLAPEAWTPLLQGCDAVLNCAGVFADSVRDSTEKVHAHAPSALYLACQRLRVRRVVHLSAIGADDGLTKFASTKARGEQALRQRDLDWVILRPSIVLGPAATGGGALIRGLASLPVLLIERGLGRIQPIQLDDLVAAILHFLKADAPARLVLDVAGPEKLTLAEAAAAYRRWLGWRPAGLVRMPGWAMAVLYAGGELANKLGWRTPISWAGRKEMRRGAEGDANRWSSIVGRTPRSLQAALAATPPSQQERLSAAMYFLTPMIMIITSLFWISTGLVSIGPGYDIGVALMEEAGVGPLAGPSVIAGGLADLAIGLGVAFRPTARIALFAAIAISVFYFVAGTVLLPRLWLDPIGPMLKIWPLVAFNIVALPLVRQR